eukprot:CAMPEP_0182436458 /NCGR_PEP_ID=MMETSP1167-20130531/81719_1 /TAXON_ID=2988 /ORGANISM="Mallomonas Sp, Strain CCMP3275" /LENGTH=186 /DNA_ID=CAMNT_0024628659 /DNA_START=373 /DNA_END=934 /DNA_ORIENTATION=+
MANGYGVLTTTSGDKYEGNWLHDQYHGHGIYTFRDGCTYDGNWYRHKESGHGVLSCEDGFRYEGEWKLGKYNGQGEMMLTSGGTYTGEFVMGRRHGKGVMSYTGGERYEGQWEEDEIKVEESLLSQAGYSMKESGCAPSITDKGSSPTVMGTPTRESSLKGGKWVMALTPMLMEDWYLGNGKTGSL